MEKKDSQLLLSQIDNILDIVYLSQDMENSVNPTSQPSKKKETPAPTKETKVEETKSEIEKQKSEQVEVFIKQPVSKTVASSRNVDFIDIAKQRTLQQYRSLEKAFKPLKTTTQNRHKVLIDEQKTVDWIAQTMIYQVITKFEEKAVFTLSLVIEKHPSMEIFDTLIDTFSDALMHFGIFSRVEIFYLDGEDTKGTLYRDKAMYQKISAKSISSYEKNLILILSYCNTPAWKSNEMYQHIKSWSEKNLCAIVQMLPRHMWLLTTLQQGVQLNWKTKKPYPINSDLYSVKESFYFDKNKKILKVPVIGFEPSSFHSYNSLVVGSSIHSISGFGFDIDDIVTKEFLSIKFSTEQRVEDFTVQASLTARKLASYLANLPVSFEVARHVQHVKLVDSTFSHLCEVFLGGIIQRKKIDGKVSFDFYEGIRDKFKHNIAPDEAWRLFTDISKELIDQFGSARNFLAIVENPKSAKTILWDEETQKFAELGIDILKRKGGVDYEEAVKIENIIKGNDTEKIKTIIPTSKRLQMGSNDGNDREKPVHEVILNYDFEIAQYPVTFEEYDLFCQDTKRKKPDDRGWGRGKRPVINVSWHDAKEYCKWLSEKTGEEYRLTTEAEWEYSCRGGTTTKWSFEDDEKELKDYAWYSKNSDKRTHPVGEKLANSWGLYDMHGNVWEWCEDDYVDNYEKTPRDGKAYKDKEANKKVLRGGSWSSNAYWSRSAVRNWDDPSIRYNFVGFRLLRTLPS